MGDVLLDQRGLRVHDLLLEPRVSNLGTVITRPSLRVLLLLRLGLGLIGLPFGLLSTANNAGIVRFAWTEIAINEDGPLRATFLGVINAFARFVSWRRADIGFALFGRGFLAVLLRLSSFALFGSLLAALLWGLGLLGRSLVRLLRLFRWLLLLSIDLRIISQCGKDNHSKESQKNDDPQDPHLMTVVSK